jgi:uncharacterized protein
MPEKRKLFERYIAFCLRHRALVLGAILLVTAFFCWHVYYLKIGTDFFCLYPPRHPYIQLYNQYRKMFGSANVLVCAVEVKDGDIYNIETIGKIDRITKELLTTEGCNAMQVISLTHPKLKNVQVTSWGIQIRAVMWPQFPQDEADLSRIRQAVYTNEGIRGFFVSPDDKAAAIFAGFWEEGVDPLKLYQRIQEIKASETDANHSIYFTGYPALYAYIYRLVPQVRNVLILTIGLLVALLFYYFRSWQGVVFPVVSGGLSAIWGMGFAHALGYLLDPLVMVIPLIVTARALSHTVQCMARYHEEYLEVQDKNEALIRGYGALFAPCGLGVLCDAVGLLLISVATIPLMRHLGFFGSFWVMTILVSVPTLTPILLSFVSPPKQTKIQREVRGRMYTVLAKGLLRLSVGRVRWVMLGILVVVLLVGGYSWRQMKVGDTEAGAALLFADHPYNQAFKFFNKKFVGATQLVIIAEGKEPGAIRDPGTLMAMEDFQRYMETEGGAGGTLTLTNMIKRIFRMFHEGNPKWEMIPDDPRHLGQVGFLIASNTSPGEMDRWLDSTWTNATITCFYKEYDSALIKRCISKAKEFIATHTPDKVRFRLAGGLLGILAAVNEEVEYSYWASLIAVFAACFVMCVVAFRSVMAGVIIILPLALSQVICETFMRLKGIDLNINTLPVAAVAVGIGIDYGIYLLARISEEYQVSRDYVGANRIALETTGKAIIFTATTIIAGVVFWVFIDLKFQAEMGLLLVILMFLNMVDAMIFIPSLVTLFKPKFVAERRLGR